MATQDHDPNVILGVEECVPPVYQELRQSDFIKSTILKLKLAIKNNNYLQRAYRLEISQGATFIRVNVVRKVNSTLHSNVVIISFNRDSTLSIDCVDEYRSDVFSFGIEGYLSKNIPADNTQALNKYIDQTVLPSVQCYVVR